MTSTYEFQLVPTKLHSDDEDSSSSEEDTVFMSSVLKSRKSRWGCTPKQSNRLFAFAIFTILLLIAILIISYIVYSINGSVSSVVIGNQTTTGGENLPSASSNNENQPPTDIVTSGSNHDHYTPDGSKSWHLDMVASTEMSVVVHDINYDGTPDLIFDLLTDKLEHMKYIVCPNKKDSCMEDTGHSPCRVHLVALDGRNGKNVWEKWTSFAPFGGNCKHDLNQDGAPDCTFSGRDGSFAAINPVDDSLLWYADPAVTFPTYNYYYPLFIRDFDKDGVTDIVTTHGGDTVYGDGVKNRSPAFIFVISGRTGQQLSERIPMPDGHETYMSPTVFKISGSIEVVLFGSGGETISGSLWAITVKSLQDNVDAWAPNKPEKYHVHKTHFDTQCLSDQEVGRMRPKFKPDTFKHVEEKEDWLSRCPVWNEDTQPLWNPYKVCVYEIVAAGITGTIIPPVIIDYNGDSVKDLLVSQFNDHVMMIDGATMKQQWDHYAEDTQSYSVPSPLNFNDDDTPDFLFRFNKGKWMMYDYSYMGVVNGIDGKLLWSMNCSLGAMGSAITVKSSKKGHDGMLFLASGCEETNSAFEKREAVNIMKGPITFNNKDVCPAAHWGAEQSMCMVKMRDKRHEGHEGPEETQFNQEDIPSGPEVLRLQDIDFTEFRDDIPTDLWNPEDENDLFPNPWTNTKAFFEQYCGVPYDRMTSKVYFLTPNMIKAGKIEPIIINRPYVNNGSHFSMKRHTSASPNSNDEILKYMKNRKNVRCAHISVPLMLVTTPTINDFNNDGKLDAAITFSYDGYPDDMYTLSLFHPPKISVDVFSIEDKMREVFGPEIDDLVDFSSYYPVDKQPWGGYMGTRGDGVYEL